MSTNSAPQSVTKPGPVTARGYLGIVLHAHLPFVRHPESDYFLEENWLYEAITETYIPLIQVFEQLLADRIPYRVTMTLTPTLCSMLADDFLQQRYLGHINRLIELAGKEVDRTRTDERFHPLANMYLERFQSCKRVFEDVNGCNLLRAFRSIQERGGIEIITSGATHPFLPTMQVNPTAVRAQIEIAAQSYESFFGTPPRGMWLPECGYFAGVERFLDDAGFRYFFVDTHGILFAEPRPTYGVFAPIFCNGTNVAAFGRDIESSRAVWSSKEGYPGDSDYREYYRDIGYDLDINYIMPYIDPIGIRINTGIKYHRITGKTDHKEPYVPQRALEKTAQHARDFVSNRERQIEYLASIMDRKPIVVSPYDAELFGHWWFEGPQWLDKVIRAVASGTGALTLSTPSDYLSAYPRNQVSMPAPSSWGFKGYSEVWLESSNDWIYRHLHMMEERMTECARAYTAPSDVHQRALNQMVRELLLAESSDWAFIMKTGTTVQYAVRRTKEHIANFTRLYDDLRADTVDVHFLEILEMHNNLFPGVDFRVYG